MTRTALGKIVIALGLFTLAIVCCLVFDTSIGAASPTTTNGPSRSDDDRRSDQESLIRLLEGNEIETLELASACFGQSFETELPDTFTAEVLDPSTFEEAYRAGSCISLTYNGSPSEAQTHCKKKLEEKGWSAIGRTNQSLASYMKKEGAYQWLTMQFLSIDSSTVVVIEPIQN